MKPTTIAAVSMLLLACGVTHYARKQYMDDHAGCAPDLMTERPDLEAQSAGTEVFEMRGCNMHELYVCATPAYTRHGRQVGPWCQSTRYCNGDGCDKDFAGVAKSLFVAQATCPVERITAGFTSKMLPPPPDDVASDAARAKIFQDTQRAALDAASARHDILITTTGCGKVGLFACLDLSPSAPTCTPAVITAELSPR